MFRSNINYQGADASTKEGETQVQCSLNREYDHHSDFYGRTLVAETSSTLGNKEIPGTVMDSMALECSLPCSTIDNVAVENGFSSNIAVLEDAINNGFYLSSLYQSVGSASQFTEPNLQTDMTRAISTDKQRILQKSAPSSFNTADLPEEGHAQFSKIMPRASEPPVQKRVAEPIFARQSKKLKGDSLLQTLDQMNGIMSQYGVDTAEEETSMLPKLTERRQSLLQEEKGSLFPKKKPLQDKLINLANDWGVQVVNDDVKLCLSLSLEEFLRRILNRLVRYLGQSQDMVKGEQKFFVTSDVGAQIRMLRQKAREALKVKELAEQKQEENHCNGNKISKNKKAAKENAAPGRTADTDGMLIKWQIMAEQARVKREREGLLNLQKKSELAGTSCATGLPSLQKKSELAGTSSTAASGRPLGIDSQALTAEFQRTITVNDLIAVLEMDPYMAKSTLLYQFYDRVRTKLQQ